MFNIYLSQGMVLKRIHRIVSFQHRTFLKEYTLSLTQLRSMFSAKNQTFFVNVFKLLANSTYGKFIQSPNNFTHAKLCLNENDFRKAINSNLFLRSSVINKDLVIV